MGKWGRVVLIVGALGLAGGAGLRLALQRQVPAQLLRSELEKTLGHPVRFRSFQLSWDAQLVLQGVELFDPDGLSFLKVDRAQLDFDRSQALEGRLVVLRLVLQRPHLEMSGERWRKLARRPARPSAARTFPLLIHSMTMRWLDSRGAPSWEVKDWRGSLPPVEAGRWKVGLQGREGETLDAQGQDERVELRLRRFPVATLATVATGAHYPSLEASANVDLDAVRSQQGWDVQADLRAQAFTGPLRLQLGPGGGLLKGVLTTPGGRLHALGEVGAVQLPFAQIGDGWKVGPALIDWRGGRWQASGQILGEDRFSGQLDCAGWPLPSQAGWQAGPAQIQLKVQGSAQQQTALFEAGVRLLRVRWRDQQLGPLRLAARGRAHSQGLPEVHWEIGGARGKWPGRLSWNSGSGDLRLSFEPLALERVLPGWKGTLSGQVSRTGRKAWNLKLSLPHLQSGGLRLEKGRIQLSGTPPRWTGGAVCNGVALTVQGALEQPVLVGKWSAASLKVKELKGDLSARLTFQPDRQLRLEVVQHNLRWKRLALPQLQGFLIGNAQGWKSQGLQVKLPFLKLPLHFSGGWTPQSWQLKGQFQDQSLAGVMAYAGLQAARAQGTTSGQLSASLAEVQWSGDLKQLRVSSQKLGTWSGTLRKPWGKPARASLVNPALVLPWVGSVKAQLTWRQGQPNGQLALSAPGLSLGAVKLGAARVLVDWSAQGPTRVQGRLGPSQVGGSLNWKQKTLALKGGLEKFSLAGLPGVPPGTQGWLVGQWTAQGLWTQPKLGFQGELRELKLLTYSLGNLPLQIQREGKQSRAALGPIGLEKLPSVSSRWPGWTGQLQLQVKQVDKSSPTILASLTNSTYQQATVAPVQVSGRWHDFQLEGADILWQVTPPLRLRGTLALKSSLSAALQGQSLETLSLGKLPLQGQAFGNLTLDDGFHFQGELRNLTASTQKLGQGRLKVDLTERLHLSGQEFDAAKVSLLQQRYPGLQGQLSFEVDSDLRKHQGRLQLRQGLWLQRAFPDVTVEGKQEGESWPLTRVEIGLQPPLQSSGRMVPASNRLELSGKLAGQSLADLTLLAGGAPPPDVFARLTGTYQLVAQQQQLHLSFQGSAQQMTYRGVALGEGQLQLQADPQLQGELILQQPLEISQLADVPGGLREVLPMRQWLSAIRLRGVRLGGRIDAPTVSPLWTTPQIQFKLPFP